MTFLLAPQAEADISEIALYIAYDSKAAAHRWADQIYKQCVRLAEMPGLGVSRDDIRPGLRMIPLGNYVILYRHSGDTIEVIRVLDARRRWRDLL